MYTPRCLGCLDTGWVSFDRVINDRTHAWSGHCTCAKGVFLASDREGTAQIPHPIRVAEAPREAYHAAVARNAEIYGVRRAA